MNNLFDWVGLGVLLFFTTTILYQAWVNLVYQKASRFSIDALLIYILQKTGSEKIKKNVKSFPSAKAQIITIGIWAFLAGLKGIQVTIVWIDKHILK